MLTEHEEQVLFVEWFRHTFPDVLLYAIPNAGKRHVRYAMYLRDEGMVAGIPDMHIPELALWIEMKRQRGGVLSPAQRDIIAHLREFNTVIVAKGAADAISQVFNHIMQRYVTEQDGSTFRILFRVLEMRTDV